MRKVLSQEDRIYTPAPDHRTPFCDVSLRTAPGISATLEPRRLPDSRSTPMATSRSSCAGKSPLMMHAQLHSGHHTGTTGSTAAPLGKQLAILRAWSIQ